MPTHPASAFPRELRCRRMDDEGTPHLVEVELFGHKRAVFGSDTELHFPAEYGGGDLTVNYELWDEDHIEGRVYRKYRKIDPRRRVVTDKSTGQRVILGPQ